MRTSERGFSMKNQELKDRTKQFALRVIPQSALRTP